MNGANVSVNGIDVSGTILSYYDEYAIIMNGFVSYYSSIAEMKLVNVFNSTQIIQLDDGF
jgi:hypothetical protein